MTDKGGDGLAGRNRRQEDSLRMWMSEPAKLHRSCMKKPHFFVENGRKCSICRYPLSVDLSAEKLEVVFRLMRVMTDYYSPHLFSG